MKYGESKEKALTFLKSSRSSIPSLNHGRRPRNHPSISKEWVMYSSVKETNVLLRIALHNNYLNKTGSSLTSLLGAS